MTNPMHPHPKFSIITVTYNAGKVLEDTIQSVVFQTYRNMEYIIVDGGSKDNTLEVAEKYRNHISQLISEPDKGLYDAMNKGIRLATGNYICFLNAGDELHENETLQKIVIPSSDTEVSMSAFRGCVNIKAIYVPQGCVDFYKEFFPRYMSWVGMFSDSGYMNFETECHGVSSRSNHGWKEQD